uniref:Chalcone/stilbene synthase N-terminal domain-containing protein n=1 Tax=Setaria digitata TaxID=48799 RepID=A0A915PIE7_9BILA
MINGRQPIPFPSSRAKYIGQEGEGEGERGLTPLPAAGSSTNRRDSSQLRRELNKFKLPDSSIVIGCALASTTTPTTFEALKARLMSPTSFSMSF